MSDDIKTLTAKTEGLAAAFMGLVATLEIDGLIDGPRYCAMLRREADRRTDTDLDLRFELQATMQTLADCLDEARAERLPRHPG